MLEVKCLTENKRVLIICERLNHLYKTNNDFWKEVIARHDNFYLGDINGVTLYNLYHASDLTVEVLTYRRFFSRANGYTKPKFKNKMWLNTAKFDRSDSSIAATIAHESIHNLDASYLHYSFGHGDNFDRPEKQNCAPQWFGNLTYKYLSNGVESKMSTHGLEFIP